METSKSMLPLFSSSLLTSSISFFALPILDFRVDIWTSDTSSLVPLDLYTPLTLPGKTEPNMNVRIHFLYAPQHGDSCQLPEEIA